MMTMATRRFPLIGLLSLGLLMMYSLLPLVAAAAPVKQAQTVVEIKIEDFTFTPGTITVKAGTKIVWTNTDSVNHTITSAQKGVFDSGILKKDGKFEYTFNTPGTYDYYCAVHPIMKGKVIVEGAAPTTAAATSAVATTVAAATTQSGTAAPAANGQQTFNITIQNFAFSPNTLTIPAGSKVIWTNKDAPAHTVTSDSGTALDSPLLKTGDTYEMVFNQPGTYAYHCEPHAARMKAQIIVEGAPVAAATTAAVATTASVQTTAAVATTAAATTVASTTSAAAPAANAQVVNITLQNFSINPNVITIPAGTKVIWTNKDSVSHTVTSDSGKVLDSPLIKSNTTFEYTFNEAGTFDYHCEPHPQMRGKIIVTAAGGGVVAPVQVASTANTLATTTATATASNDTGQLGFLIIALALLLAMAGGGYFLGRATAKK